MILILLLAQVYGTWPKWGGNLANASIQTMKGAMTGEPVVKWGFAPGISGGSVEWQHSAIGDVDGDGAPEVIMGSWDNKLYCLRGSNGSQKWSFTGGNFMQSSPAIGNVDLDGAIEVVVGSGDDKVYCLRGSNGTQKWVFTTGGDVFSSPAIVDVDRDGVTEVIIGSDDGKVYCLRGTDGTQKWVFAAGGRVRSSPAVADLEGDGALEVVVGSWDRKVYCLSESGGQKWSFSTRGYITSSPVIADVDQNGILDVVIGCDDSTVYCLDGSSGAQKWAFPTGGKVQSSPAVADVDGDGAREVVVGSWDRKVYCLRGSNGTQKWSFTTAAPVHNPFCLADVDGDNRLEILVPNQMHTYDTLYCLRGTGTLLWKKGLPYDVHSPFAGDIDGDGCIEIMVGTLDPDPWDYSRIFALDDPGNTQGCGQVNTEEGDRGPEVFELRPAGAELHLIVSGTMRVSLDIYDPSGRFVQSLYRGFLNKGEYHFIPETRGRGVYLVVLSSPDGIRVVKMVR